MALPPVETDVGLQFDADVGRLLPAHEHGADGAEVLLALPQYARCVTEVTLEASVARLAQTIELHNALPVAARDAVKIDLPLWRTTDYRVAVLMEAWSRSSGIPTALYIDSFWCFAASLVHKSVGTELAGFKTRARYWCAGTAEPGSGKSPALEPLREALLEAMQEHRAWAPGSSADGFHVQLAGTHAAAVDRLRHTGGYEILAAGEGGPLLCPSWPTHSSWNQATHVNMQRYLDSAYGGEVPWETLLDRRARDKEIASATGTVDLGVTDRETNVVVLLLQQVSVLSQWWAQGEEKCNIGLASRFLFSLSQVHASGRVSGSRLCCLCASACLAQSCRRWGRRVLSGAMKV